MLGTFRSTRVLTLEQTHVDTQNLPQGSCQTQSVQIVGAALMACAANCNKKYNSLLKQDRTHLNYNLNYNSDALKAGQDPANLKGCAKMRWGTSAVRIERSLDSRSNLVQTRFTVLLWRPPYLMLSGLTVSS